MKEVHPRLWMDNHISAHTFFVNEMGELVEPLIKRDVIDTPHLQLEIF
jgi:hypothetical protein